MTYGKLRLEKKGHIGVITLDHPPANAFSLNALREVENALDDLESDPDIRVIIITGQGEKCFSAGFDVNDTNNAFKTGPGGQHLWTRVDRFPKPVIAAINGHALGGGLELALSCHFRIMTDNPNAKVGLTELNLGLIPAWGGTQRMARQLGRTKALELILLSKKLSAAEALKLGLVSEVCPASQLMKAAMELGEKLAEKPPIAVSCVLKAVSAGLDNGMDAGLRVEQEGLRIVENSEDVQEGITAFMEKRAPVFKGK